VSVNEIEEALKSLASNKAPGLDGFPASFFKQYWPIVKDKIVAKVLDFYNSWVMAKSWKHTFIALIPKCKTPSKVEHYRPNSLCNNLYKLFAKSLSEGWRVFFGELISPEQGAFVPRKSISDNLPIAQEIANSLESSHEFEQFTLAKVDMEGVWQDALRVCW